MLSIALNGKNEVLVTKLVNHLNEFYTKKQYKVITIEEIPRNTGKYELNEALLLKALNRSLKYNNIDLNQFQLVIWNGSIIDDYQLIKGKNIPSNFVSKINKYFPTHDLYITIGEPVKVPKSYKYFNVSITNDENQMFEEIVKLIFDNLPRCQWCGRLFQTSKSNYKYCCKKCSQYGWEENNRRNNREYYKRNKEHMGDKRKGALGSKGANLHAKADPDPVAELQKVRNAKKALGLKPIQ